MTNSKIKLVYRQIIDENSQSGFEKAIYHASYQEFLLKSQAYNMDGRLKTFSKIKEKDGRANSLHYKLSFSVGHFIAQLNNKIHLVKDNQGNKLPFDTARFELIESHTEDITLHKVAINYETGALLLVNIIGDYMILANADADENLPLETFTLKMQPDLSVTSYQEIAALQHA